MRKHKHVGLYVGAAAVAGYHSLLHQEGFTLRKLIFPALEAAVRSVRRRPGYGAYVCQLEGVGPKARK
jgi:hypothetical protein